MSDEHAPGPRPTARVPIPVLIHQGAALPPYLERAAFPLSSVALEALVGICGAAEHDLDALGSAEPETVRDLVAELTSRSLLGGTGAVETDAPDAPTSSSPTLDLTREHLLRTPTMLRATAAGYERVDHDGRVSARLTPAELALAIEFETPRRPSDLLATVPTLEPHDVERVLTRLVAAGLLIELGPGEGPAEPRHMSEFRANLIRNGERARLVDEVLARRELEEEARVAATGTRRTKVVPVNIEGVPILSLGMVMSYAMVWSDGVLDDAYEFVPDWLNRTVPSITAETPPAIYLFSNYIWSHNFNLAASAEVKEKSPGSITVHGGPDTPRFAGDVADYFAANPQVDVAVHGEGEITFAEMLAALRGSLTGGPPDLDVLRDVPGLTYRVGDRIVTTAERERMSDLDIVPSPYLNGLFDSVGDSTRLTLQTIETNRGCPYGCTYCDWGSATLSRIRKFDLQRVFDEIEWCGRHKANVIFIADANFGIFERDVAIARKVVEVRQQYGYPRLFESSYAKNTVKHLREIIEVLADGGVLATGTVALQSLDEQTLATIRRSNIKTEKYDELAAEFGKQQLPLVVDILIGLPGSTPASLLNDLQECVDREVRARVSPVELLVNSPMNEPEYRAENAIEVSPTIRDSWIPRKTGARKKALVVASSTFTQDDFATMLRYRRLFVLFENFGVLRQVGRFVRQETGIREMDLLAAMDADALADPSRWPSITTLLEVCEHTMIPPVSWRPFIDDVGRYLVERTGVADDDALATVLTVQHALLPAPDRQFPHSVDLPHDYASWFEAAMSAKRAGHARDWGEVAPRLGSFGPATFEVVDRQDLCNMDLGSPLHFDHDSDWEMDSPVSRRMSFRNTVHSG